MAGILSRAECDNKAVGKKIFHWQAYRLPTIDGQFDNIVVSGGTISCNYGKLWCHQWQQSYQIDDLLFSV